MSTYMNEYCPYCKKAITLHERSEFFSYNRYIGLKFERCPHCKKIYSTKRKLYFEMNSTEQSHLSKIYFFNTLSTIITLYVIMFLVIIFIADCIIKANIGENIRLLGFIPIIPSIILGLHISKRNYKDIKNLKYEDFEIDDELKNTNIYNTLNYNQEQNDVDLLSNLINTLEKENHNGENNGN